GAAGARRGIPSRTAQRRLRAPVRPKRAGRARTRRVRSVRRPKAAPLPPNPPEFPALGIREHTLPNGLRLLLLENHDLPSVTLAARVVAGSRDDTDQAAGLADFTARMRDEGARDYS